MKNWPGRYYLLIFLVLLLTALVYYDSFLSPFFQDDKILLELARSTNKFAPIPNFPYRPVSIQMFYGLSSLLFGKSVFGFHLTLFLFFAGTLFLIFSFTKRLFKSTWKGTLSAIFYALNVSLFANFYWVATSYFVMGTFFIFLTCCLYRDRPGLAFISFLLALGSNEIAFVLPALLALINFVSGNWPRRFWLFLAADVALLVLRVAFIGFPKVADYALRFDLSTLATTRWYVLRALNLPEGIDRAANPVLLGAFAVFLVVVLVSLTRLKKTDLKTLGFGICWFFLGALPFFFLPGHMSSYYLTLSLYGTALVLGTLFKKKHIALIAVALYLLLTVTGLEFLRGSHWIILKNTGPIGSF